MLGGSSWTRATAGTTARRSARAFDAALKACGRGGDVYVLPTYTALLEFKALLADRGLAPEFWEDQ